MNDFDKFCNDFDIVENALQMRTLVRWNGRDLREKENLSEHTHLTVTCIFKLIDSLPENYKNMYDVEHLIRHALVHDSLELLRGDILSITKDIIPHLRKFTDDEERAFMCKITKIQLNEFESDLLLLADLMACYKFVEREIRFPSNDFAKQAYVDTKLKYDEHYKVFCKKYKLPIDDSQVMNNDLVKGYANDAGVDVVLNEDVTFLPMSTCTINLKITCTPEENVMSYLCARTSAAAKGLVVAQCPIDPHFTGEVTAIVHNVSNQVITYSAGEAFCQIVTVPFTDAPVNYVVKHEGKRGDGKLGSTGGVKC